MPELLLHFDEPVLDAEGRAFAAQVWAREDELGRWTAWLEFEARDGTIALRTDTETVQPNRRDLEYWVTSLSRVYLDEALARVRENITRPRSSGAASLAASVERPREILDPFATYAQGEAALRSELRALSAEHLRNIAAAFAISSPETSATLNAAELAEEIVAAARRRAASHGEMRA